MKNLHELLCRFGCRRSSASLMLMCVGVTLLVGCQAFAPGGLAGISLPGEDTRIAKQAQNDPFPSPADVGIEQPNAVR